MGVTQHIPQGEGSKATPNSQPKFRPRNEETATFLSALAKAKALESHLVLQGRVKRHTFAARAFSLSLLDRRPVHGTGADIPSVHEVLRDARFS